MSNVRYGPKADITKQKEMRYAQSGDVFVRLIWTLGFLVGTVSIRIRSANATIFLQSRCGHSVRSDNTVSLDGHVLAQTVARFRATVLMVPHKSYRF